MSWIIPGTLAVGLAFATTFITVGPAPVGPLKACTQIAVTGDGTVSVSDCEGNR